MQNASIPEFAPISMRRIAPLLTQLPLQQGHFRIRDLAERVRGLNPLARIEGVKLSVRTTDPNDESRFEDRDRVIQLTTSLVSLAVRYSRNGTVTLHVGRSADRQLRLCLTFADIGEADRDQRLLWSGGNRSGTTLQSVVQKFVDIGASVGIAAGLRGQTELSIRLSKAHNPSVPQVLAGYHICIAGRSDTTLETTSSLLQSRGASVEIFGRGRPDAAGRCDIIIVDVDSVEDEAATLFEVRETERLRGHHQAPALALVGVAAREDIERYFCIGFDALAFKPICIDEICRNVRALT